MTETTFEVLSFNLFIALLIFHGVFILPAAAVWSLLVIVIAEASSADCRVVFRRVAADGLKYRLGAAVDDGDTVLGGGQIT